MTDLELQALLTECHRVVKSALGPLKYHAIELERLKSMVEHLCDKYPPKPILEPKTGMPNDN